MRLNLAQVKMIRDFFIGLKYRSVLVSINRLDNRCVKLYLHSRANVVGIMQINDALEEIKRGVSLREYVENYYKRDEGFSSGIPLLKGGEARWEIEPIVESYLKDIAKKIGRPKIPCYLL